MRKVLTIRTVAVLGVALMGLVLSGSRNQTEARPAYLKQFVTQYDALAEQARQTKCNVCHFSTSKKNRNDYGRALMKHVGKNQRDFDKIGAALGIVEKEKKNGTTTFGDLIKAGKLPGTAPVSE